MIEKIIFDKVSLSFGAKEIFANFTTEFNGGKIFAVTGANGSGKSTLLKLAGMFITADSGTVTAIENNQPLDKISYRKKISVIAPSLKIYSELTAAENFSFFTQLRGKNFPAEKINQLFEKVGLNVDDTKKFVGNFSTGMAQRLKFAIMLAVDADVWLLDEPCGNLDAAGKKIFYTEIKNAANCGKIILLATNDTGEAKFGDEIISLPIA